MNDTEEEILNSHQKIGDDEERENKAIARFGDALLPLVNRYGFEGINTIGILMTRLRQEDPETALYLMEKSPAIIENLLPHGEELVLKIFDLAVQMLSSGALVTIRFLEISPRIVAEHNLDTLLKTAMLVCRVADVHIETAVSLIEKSPDLIDAVGFEGLEKVAEFTATIANSSWTYALKAVENSLFIINQLLNQGGETNGSGCF